VSRRFAIESAGPPKKQGWGMGANVFLRDFSCRLGVYVALLPLPPVKPDNIFRCSARFTCAVLLVLGKPTIIAVVCVLPAAAMLMPIKPSSMATVEARTIDENLIRAELDRPDHAIAQAPFATLSKRRRVERAYESGGADRLVSLGLMSGQR